MARAAESIRLARGYPDGVGVAGSSAEAGGQTVTRHVVEVADFAQRGGGNLVGCGSVTYLSRGLRRGKPAPPRRLSPPKDAPS